MNLSNKQKPLLFLILFLLVSNAYAQKGKWINKKIDYSQVESRIDSFTMKENNDVKGYWIWKTENTPNEIVFTDISVLHNTVEERFKMIFNKKNGVTKRVDLKIETDEFKLSADIERTKTYNLKANYQLSGNTTRSKIIDTTYNKQVILRPEVFGLLPLISNKKDLNENLDVFLLSSAFISNMSLKFIEEEKVIVPAGEFNTYKIQFASTNQISNIIYINKEKPFNIVKVEIVGNPLEMVLVNSQLINSKNKN